MKVINIYLKDGYIDTKKCYKELGTFNENKIKFFENFMIRLILHGESHLENQTRANNFYDYISPEEKKKSAKYLLIFLRLLKNYI